MCTNLDKFTSRLKNRLKVLPLKGAMLQTSKKLLSDLNLQVRFAPT